jgi:putative flippase GtrA
MGERLRQLLRFCAVGLTCLGLSLAVLGGLHGLAGLNYLLAYVASFIAGNVAGYLLNARFTFPVETVSHTGAARYMLVNAILLCANTAALKVLVSAMHVWYIAAAILLAAINAPVSFLAQRLVTYRTSTANRLHGL